MSLSGAEVACGKLRAQSAPYTRRPHKWLLLLLLLLLQSKYLLLPNSPPASPAATVEADSGWCSDRTVVVSGEVEEGKDDATEGHPLGAHEGQCEVL